VIKHHLKHMAIAAAVVLALLLAVGVDLSGALRYALLLACPLGMLAMMLVMGRGHGGHGNPPHPHAGPHPAASDETQPSSADRPRDDHERVA
jgi:hypothetical protein